MPIERYLLTSNNKFRIEKFTILKDTVLPSMYTTPAFHILTVLDGEIEIEDVDTVQKVKSDEKDEKKIKTQKAKGKGFDAIAGMKELKAQLQ